MQLALWFVNCPLRLKKKRTKSPKSTQWVMPQGPATLLHWYSPLCKKKTNRKKSHCLKITVDFLKDIYTHQRMDFMTFSQMLTKVKASVWSHYCCSCYKRIPLPEVAPFTPTNMNHPSRPHPITDVADATEEESVILDWELHLENNRAPWLFLLSAFWAVSSLLKTLKSATNMVTSITSVLWMQAAGWISLALRVDHRLEKSSCQTISAFLLPLKWPLSDLHSNVHDWVLSSQKPVR